MSITHESVVSMLVETLEAVDGAGSDLVTGWRSGEWLDVQGNLDLHHLASDILILVDQAKAEALREAMTDEALEAARALIENELVEWRNSSMFVLRNNGLSIRNKDGSGSEIIRFGFEMGYRMALNDRLETIEGKSE